MLRMIGARLMTTIPSVIGVIIVTFLLTRVLPGDTAAYFAGPAASNEAIAEIRGKLGLDQPLPVQFVSYIGALVRGDLGTSLTTGQPVTADIAQRLPASGELTLAGLLLAMAVALPLGVLAAVKQGSWVDHLCRIVATAGVSLPVFFTGLLLVYVFYFILGWAPAPLGRIDVFFSEPPRVTGFLLIDSLIARDLDTFRAAASQLIPEDSDLCLKARAAGRRIGVARDIALTHLERQSVGLGESGAFRTRVTLFNAWLHQERWRAALDREAGLGTQEQP